jgi:hypothetical protein
VKLQDYTAVEKDEVTLDCELSKDVPVMWYHNETEIKASKMVTISAEANRRVLSIKKVDDRDKGQYICDCGTDKTMANINIEGKQLQMFVKEQTFILRTFVRFFLVIVLFSILNCSSRYKDNSPNVWR